MPLPTHSCYETMKLSWITMLTACRHPPAPQKFHSMPGQRSSQGQYRTEQPPADIADSILTNPWTAALMQGDSDRPQLYSNNLALTRIGIGSWAAEPADARAVPQPGLQGHTQSQQVPGDSVKVDLSSYKTAAASLCGSQEEDEHGLESKHIKQATDSCSSLSEDGAGSVCGHRHAHHEHDHRQGRTAQHDSPAWPQDQSKPAGPMLHKASSAASDSHHADALVSSSDKGSSDRARSDEGSSGRVCSDKARSGRGSSPNANSAHATHAQPACRTGWTAAFTDNHGEQAQGLPRHDAAPNSDKLKSTGGKQRGFASWIGDFGHLEGRQFNKQQGRAWQAYMRSQRDQPSISSSSSHSISEVGEVCSGTSLVCGSDGI